MAPRLSDGAPKLVDVEGTLSLFDWRPEPVGRPAAEAAPASEPVAAPVAPAGPRIVVFDCETTGTDRTKDQVIELCVQRGLEEDAPSQVWRIKPLAPIHPGAQAVHGIAIEDLAQCPMFEDIADEVAAVFADADIIVGYNLTFDIDMLQAEYARIGQPLLDFASKKIVPALCSLYRFGTDSSTRSREASATVPSKGSSLTVTRPAVSV